MHKGKRWLNSNPREPEGTKCCMLYKICCNTMHPLNSALPGPYVPVRVTRDTLVAHWYNYALPLCRTSQYHRTFVPSQCPSVTILMTLYSIIIIIVIEKDWQCNAGTGRMTPYQSKDPSPTLPTYRGKEEKMKIVKDKKERATRSTKSFGPALETRQSHTIEYPTPTRSLQRNADRRIKVLWYCQVLQRGGAKWMHRVTPDLVEHTQHCHRFTMGKIRVKHATS